MKFKSIFSAIVLFSLCFVVNAAPFHNIQQYTMENGMDVFLLEDTSTPLVRFEYTVRAGFSSQTQETSGFFQLYANILKNMLSQLNLDDVQCNADSTRLIVTIPPSKLEETADLISICVFDPSFSNDVLDQELTVLKKTVVENASSMGGFINSAIDSRVFSAAPWKHDSGVYPPLFNKTTVSAARTILNTISERWYTPQNSAVFISGNFNSKKVRILLEQTFGRFYSTYSLPAEKPSLSINNHRKYVLHDMEFSPDLTQIVVQFVNLDSEECDIAAAVMNNDYSSFKNKLLESAVLNIPGAEYINVASAHKKNSSRLIIQSLLQKPEMVDSGVNSVTQTVEFLNKLGEAVEKTPSAEFYSGEMYLLSELNAINSTSAVFMENLSSWWALEPYKPFTEQSVETPQKSITAANMMSRSEKLENLSFPQIKSTLSEEEPFIFVIINTGDFEANRDFYLENDFEEVTLKNASWYNQADFRDFDTDFEEENDSLPVFLEDESADNNFYENSLKAVSKFNLKNGIPVVTKFNDNSTQVTLLISIKGGKINTAADHGFEEAMMNIISANVQKEILNMQRKGKIFGAAEVSVFSEINTSSLIVNCQKEDLNSVCQAFSSALIYADILPASADRAVSARQHKKRLENGSSVNQMFSEVVKQMLPSSSFVKIFDTQKDVLEKTSYNQILTAYTAFLDADRYTVIVSGNFDSKLKENLNASLGLLAGQNQKLNTENKKIVFPRKKTATVKINHTFLTDIPAEKAGPMPAVLVPTTEFLDPVLFVFEAPAAGKIKERALFEAEFLYLGNVLQSEVSKNSRMKGSSVYVILPHAKMDFGTVVIQNVAHTAEADSVMRQAVLLLQEKLAVAGNEKVIQEIKDNWLINELGQAGTNEGTAKLLQQGIEYLPENPDVLYYLEKYKAMQEAAALDYINTAFAFPESPNLRVYSKESVK